MGRRREREKGTEGGREGGREREREEEGERGREKERERKRGRVGRRVQGPETGWHLASRIELCADGGKASRVRANMAHMRQPRPHSGPAFQVKVVKPH